MQEQPNLNDREIERYDNQVSKFSRVLLGSTMLGITVILSMVFIGCLATFRMETISIVGTTVFGLLSYWFGQTAIKLLFNKRNVHGGLFSSRTLKIFCAIFAVASIVVLVAAITERRLMMIYHALTMLAGCFAGWVIAYKRELKGKELGQ